MIFKILKIVITGVILSSSLWAAQNACNTEETAGVTIDKRTQLCQIASTLKGIDCLSQDSNTIKKSEYHLLHFLSVIQELVLEKDRRSQSAYALWKKGAFLSYYTIENVEWVPDMHVRCISPSNARKMNFPTFPLNIYIESEIERLLLDHPACLFASEFLKEYCEDAPCLLPKYQEYTKKIKSESDAKMQLSYLHDMLDEIVNELQKTISNEERIIQYSLLSYFIKITPTGTKCWEIAPKRPKVLNFNRFAIEVDDQLIMMLHYYGIELPR